MPPSRKIETSTRSSPAAACAIPSSQVAEPELRGAVDGQHRGARAQQEGASGEPGPGGHRHPGLDRRQPLARLGDGAAHEVRAGELLAVVAGHRAQLARLQVGGGGDQQSAARSGAGRGRCSAASPRSRRPRPRTRSARALDVWRGETPGSPQKASARRTAIAGPSARRRAPPRRRRRVRRPGWRRSSARGRSRCRASARRPSRRRSAGRRAAGRPCPRPRPGPRWRSPGRGRAAARRCRRPAA